MEYLKDFLYVVEVVVCLLLALVVMLQKPKEGGLGGAFGGGALEASLGADAGNVLIKATSVLGAIFLINTLAIVAITSSTTSAYGKVHADDAKLWILPRYRCRCPSPRSRRGRPGFPRTCHEGTRHRRFRIPGHKSHPFPARAGGG